MFDFAWKTSSYYVVLKLHVGGMRRWRVCRTPLLSIVSLCFKLQASSHFMKRHVHFVFICVGLVLKDLIIQLVNRDFFAGIFFSEQSILQKINYFCNQNES